eukprot:scaffold412519_cov34-Prasinocladus_malaysianus.AAC.1
MDFQGKLCNTMRDVCTFRLDASTARLVFILLSVCRNLSSNVYSCWCRVHVWCGVYSWVGRKVMRAFSSPDKKLSARKSSLNSTHSTM